MFVMNQFGKIGEHAVHHALVVILFSVVGMVTGVIWHRWKMSRYGMRVTTRVCWMEKDLSPKLTLIDKVVRTGSALEMAGGKDAAAALVRAAKRCRAGQDVLISHPCWQLKIAKSVLERLSNGVEAKFAGGSIAKAMRDKDVTRGEFLLAAFRRGDEVSVIMARTEDLRPFLLPNYESQIEGDVEEMREMKRLSSLFLDYSNECATFVVLYM